MSPVIYKRLSAFEKCQSSVKQLVIHNETLDDRDIDCIVSLLSDQHQLTALALDFCNLNISELAFCKLMHAVAINDSLLAFRLTGKLAGDSHKFLIDNPNKLNAIRELVLTNHNLRQLGLANLIYNRHYIKKIVNDARNHKQDSPIALEFGAILVDLPRVAAEVDRLNEAAAQAANDKKLDTKMNPEQPHKRQSLFEELLASFKSKFGFLQFNDPRLVLPSLL